MLLGAALIVTFALIIIISESDSTRINTRDGHKEFVQRRDYRPTKWITNSAIEIWYGNRTFIDIVWREFSDFMFKLTDRRGE